MFTKQKLEKRTTMFIYTEYAGWQAVPSEWVNQRELIVCPHAHARPPTQSVDTTRDWHVTADQLLLIDILRSRRAVCRRPIHAVTPVVVVGLVLQHQHQYDI